MTFSQQKQLQQQMREVDDSELKVPVTCEIFDQFGEPMPIERVTSQYYDDASFFQLDDEEPVPDREQTLLTMLLQKRFVRIIQREQDGDGFLRQKTPVRQETPRPMSTIRGRCPFSTTVRRPQLRAPTSVDARDFYNPYRSETAALSPPY